MPYKYQAYMNPQSVAILNAAARNHFARLRELRAQREAMAAILKAKQ
jgi:hypothetical protein